MSQIPKEDKITKKSNCKKVRQLRKASKTRRILSESTGDT